MGDPVTGDMDLEARGLVIFGEDFLSSAAGGLPRGGEGGLDVELLFLLITLSVTGGLSWVPSSWAGHDFVG